MVYMLCSRSRSKLSMTVAIDFVLSYLTELIRVRLMFFFLLDCTVATPKQIRELMKVDGLTNDEVKSHLQVRVHTFDVSSFNFLKMFIWRRKVQL